MILYLKNMIYPSIKNNSYDDINNIKDIAYRIKLKKELHIKISEKENKEYLDYLHDIQDFFRLDIDDTLCKSTQNISYDLQYNKLKPKVCPWNKNHICKIILVNNSVCKKCSLFPIKK